MQLNTAIGGPVRTDRRGQRLAGCWLALSTRLLAMQWRSGALPPLLSAPSFPFFLVAEEGDLKDGVSQRPRH